MKDLTFLSLRSGCDAIEMLMLARVTIPSRRHNTLCLSVENISTIASIIIADCQEKGPDARVTFETFLPMLQDVSSKPIRDTVDDFVEVRTRQRGGLEDDHQTLCFYLGSQAF